MVRPALALLSSGQIPRRALALLPAGPVREPADAFLRVPDGAFERGDPPARRSGAAPTSLARFGKVIRVLWEVFTTLFRAFWITRFQGYA